MKRNKTRQVAECPDEGEIASFINSHDETMAVADILLESPGKCRSDFDLYASDYL